MYVLAFVAIAMVALICIIVLKPEWLGLGKGGNKEGGGGGGGRKGDEGGGGGGGGKGDEGGGGGEDKPGKGDSDVFEPLTGDFALRSGKYCYIANEKDPQEMRGALVMSSDCHRLKCLASSLPWIFEGQEVDDRWYVKNV